MEFLEVPCEVMYGDVERVGGEHTRSYTRAGLGWAAPRAAA
jgi:hypothetical protein